MTDPAGRLATATGRGGPTARGIAAVVRMPVRQFLCLVISTLAITIWMVFGLSEFTGAMSTEPLDEVLADLGAGDGDGRWQSFYAALLVRGHLPVLAALALWGGVLTVHSLIHEVRAPFDEVGLRLAESDPNRYVPGVMIFWGSALLGVLCNVAANRTASTGPALYWDEHYGPAQWVALLWWSYALVTAVATGILAWGRRRGRRHEARSRPSGERVRFDASEWGVR